MASSMLLHLEDVDIPNESRVSHWLPALRPDTLDPSLSSPIQPIEDNNPAQEDLGLSQEATSSINPPAEEFAPQKDITAKGVEHSADDDNNILAQLQRSTSFPVPTGEAAEQTNEADDIMPWDLPDTQSSALDFENVVNGIETSTQAQLSDVPRSAEEPVIYSEVSGTEIPGLSDLTQGDASDRFDEGVPLLSPENLDQGFEQDSIRAKPVDGNAFGEIEGEAEEDFFSQLNNAPAESVQPPTLDRKSTMDVLASLDIEDKDETDSPTDFFQNLGQSSNPDQAESEKQNVDPVADDPWAAALEDDDDFLVGNHDQALPKTDPDSPSAFIAALQGQGDFAEFDLNAPDPPAQNPYAPPRSSNSTAAPVSTIQPSPNTAGNLGLSRPGFGPIQSFQAQLQQQTQPITQRAESFVEQSKGGYKSPYDLPLDISVPKKKPQVSRVVSQPQKGLVPPPRSSSMTGDKALQTPFSPNSPASLPPPSAGATTMAARPGTAPQQRVASSSSFFEELPIKTRPRPSPNPARYTPTQASVAGQPSLTPSSPPQRVASTPSDSIFAASKPNPVDFQLRPPERLDPYANVALQASTAPPAASTARYSPAPGSAPGAPKPSPSPRYSPAPPAQQSSSSGRYASPPLNAQSPSPNSAAASRYASQPTSVPPTSAASFQPRTSSPLAYHTKPAENASALMPPPPVPKSASAASSPSSNSPQEYANRSATPSKVPAIPPPQAMNNPYAPEFAPPKRSQTQSPSRQSDPRPTFPHVTQKSIERPASVQAMISPARQPASYVPSQSVNPRVATAPDMVDFVQPSDGTENDPLERWKGAPIVSFGFGGQTVTSFPTRTPRYSSGMLKPQMKSGPGEVKVQKTDGFSPLPSHVTSFPGPLRGKSKKKEVLNWLTTSITRLEAESPSFLGLAQIVPDPRKRHEEKILLWRLVKTLVECDGHLDTSEALKSINIILTPEVHAIDESTASQHTEGNETGGIYRPRGASARLEPVNPTAAEDLRKQLLKGNRKDAVWLAVDNRLWSHALLIASTLEPALWRQVVQEFVRQEVKTVGHNTESLAALYEIFGGNMEDSVDQLVPPSARAGLQMVSTVESTGPIRNALDGLDKWKETLALVLNNRCRDDYTALLTLARLLGDYGRVEASHICFLFARNPAFPTIFGGLDDPQASAVLVGADHRNRPAEIHHDDDAVLLTEVYEFATCILAGASAAAPVPHLASYKLHRAKQLADHGYKAEAQAYCDVVAAGLKSGGKVSPYYHPVLLSELDDLSSRLKQIPIQGSSWMSKPSIEKVSGSIFSKFTNFVAGDDSDAASQTSGKDGGVADVGPFANIAGSPSMSRSGSPSNTYGSYGAPASAAPATMAGSRYAPNGVLSTRSSSEFARGRPSLDSQRSPPGTSYGFEPRQSIYSPMGSSSQTQSPARSVSYQPLGTSPNQQFASPPNYAPYQSTPPQSSYLTNPTPLQPSIAEEQQSGPYMPTPPPEELSPYVPTVAEGNNLTASGAHHAFGGYLPPQNNFSADLSTDEPVAAPSEPQQSYGYEPPSDTGYVPYQPEPDSDDDKGKKPAKKSFMDDDQGDDFGRVSNAGQHATASSMSQPDDVARRKANDAAAEAAFRAAAEADAQRAKEAAAAKRSSGWFGGWLGGGKKGDTALDAKAPVGEQKVHKANLGESKMKLYYDNDLKKWVNPDDPDGAKSKTSTPPPPRMGGTPVPPRAGGAPPPPALSRSNTPASASGMPPPSSDGIAATLPPSVNASLGLSKSTAPSPIGPPPTPGGATPNRTPTSAVSTNAIDDLLGPPTGGRKVGGRGKKAKAGRYVDVMAK